MTRTGDSGCARLPLIPHPCVVSQCRTLASFRSVAPLRRFTVSLPCVVSQCRTLASFHGAGLESGPWHGSTASPLPPRIIPRGKESPSWSNSPLPCPLWSRSLLESSPAWLPRLQQGGATGSSLPPRIIPSDCSFFSPRIIPSFHSAGLESGPARLTAPPASAGWLNRVFSSPADYLLPFPRGLFSSRIMLF